MVLRASLAGAIVVVVSCVPVDRFGSRGALGAGTFESGTAARPVPARRDSPGPDVARMPGSSAQGGEFPNLPAGFRLVSDLTWSAESLLPPVGSPGGAGGWQRLGGAQRIDVGPASGAGCPAGPFGENVLRGRVPRLFNVRPDRSGRNRPRGVGPWSMELLFDREGTRYNDVYQAIWTATPADFDEGRNYGHKWSWLLGPGSGSRTNHFWAIYDRTPEAKPTLVPRFVTQFNGSWARNGQQFSAPPSSRMFHGRWHRVELLVRGGTPGRRDGSVGMWVDGVPFINVGSAPILPPEAMGRLQGFRGVRWNPTWGGEDGQPIDTYICVARWAVFVAAPLP